MIPEQDMRTQGFFGSDRGYDLRATQGTQNLRVLGQEEIPRKRKAGDLDVLSKFSDVVARVGVARDC